MNQVLIRTDANSQIGLGHLIRCLSLASYLKNEHQITFAIKNPSIQVQNIMKGQNFDFFELGVNELESLKKYLNNDIDFVLDGYLFDYEYQKSIKPFCKRLFYIDDLNKGEFCADYVINHSLSALEEDYPKIPGVKYLLGYDYILLREEFLSSFPNKAPREKVEIITICMGGADKDNIILKLTESVVSLNQEIKLNLIFGAASNNLSICKDRFSKNKGINYYSNLNANEMCKLLKKSNIVIAPASGIAHESISLGIPLITGVIAKNHEKIAEYIGKKHLGENLGWFGSLAQDEISIKIFKLIKDQDKRLKFFNNQTKIIDRKSKERFKKIFESNENKICNSHHKEMEF